MDFSEFLPEETSEEEIIEETEKIGQSQFYDIVTSRKPDWQSIIYELIHTNQLDPWDINIIFLTQKYFEKIQEMEEADYYVSSKVLLAAALLLRIKSEFLLNKHLRSIDEVLFGKKQESKDIEKIEINEDEIPVLIPKTPLPRSRKVTLPELMAALNKAITTESRRIKREVAFKRSHKLSHVDIPEFRRIDLKDRIKQFYAKILTFLRKKSVSHEKHLNKVAYSDLIGKEREEKLASFLPLLHLSNSRRLWIEQQGHLEEIWVYLYEYFKKNKDKFIEELEEDLEEMREDLVKEAEAREREKYEKIEEKKISGLEKARLKKEAKKKLQNEIKKELEEELGTAISDIEEKEKIEESTGFADE
ncbi:hypothetical protein GF386_05670 [Candidatus Pacearchaeota archaeon]|nr:hypothetical protein [Candidatus Pacearchaeota archaeon]MBD3283582.1 hypothetical protein [Candidatus Pacearchaeota archaeon]